ncbi:hypothetical protein SARC_08388 [Sphaeroforma arctica JP610]|uniref:Uncharacterized protein n=1 Tax=Sphaeroforma arctica JP610 TaxID=667725 RepID=A0A0L0FRA5_9EUKA|nr:hypothetical protein SARC_08388 [Sphaeroforma arctica JP610]KNC79219.1 hypothetical protein SARC_08388 [Sphaeroforma arctica JP610]|eukprot:XP_014153121.1 hypothetical protein SARC_08388 [Sphaeroforma arctica JP610]
MTDHVITASGLVWPPSGQSGVGALMRLLDVRPSAGSKFLLDYRVPTGQHGTESEGQAVRDSLRAHRHIYTYAGDALVNYLALLLAQVNDDNSQQIDRRVSISDEFGISTITLCFDFQYFVCTEPQTTVRNAEYSANRRRDTSRLTVAVTKYTELEMEMKIQPHFQA